MVICCRSLLLQDCLHLPFVQHRRLFLMSECARPLSAHMAPRGRVGVPCSFSKHANVLRSGGSRCKGAAGSPPDAQQPNNGAMFGSEGVKQTHCKWHFYLLAFVPSPNILHLLGSAVPFPGAPWQRQALSTGGQLSHDVTKPR